MEKSSVDISNKEEVTVNQKGWGEVVVTVVESQEETNEGKEESKAQITLHWWRIKINWKGQRRTTT